jgi:hypothetical protein
VTPGPSARDIPNGEPAYSVGPRDGIRVFSCPLTKEDVARHGCVDLRPPFVSGLLDETRPATVARFVVAIIVNAINRCTNWSVSHVSKEVRERLSPAIAYRNAPSSVATVGPVIWIMTALDHLVPYAVKRILPHGSPSGISMFLRCSSIFASSTKRPLCRPTATAHERAAAGRTGNANLGGAHGYWLTSVCDSSMPNLHQLENT